MRILVNTSYRINGPAKQLFLSRRRNKGLGLNSHMKVWATVTVEEVQEVGTLKTHDNGHINEHFGPL